MVIIARKLRLLWGSLLVLPLIYLYLPRNVSHLLHTRPWRRASGPIANGTAGVSVARLRNINQSFEAFLCLSAS